MWLRCVDPATGAARLDPMLTQTGLISRTSVRTHERGDSADSDSVSMEAKQLGVRGRVSALVLLCPPGWVVLSVFGPMQWLESQRELGQVLHPVLLLLGAIIGFPISLVTTPSAVFTAVSYARTEESQRAAIAYIVLALSAVSGTLGGMFVVWRVLTLPS